MFSSGHSWMFLGALLLVALGSGGGWPGREPAGTRVTRHTRRTQRGAVNSTQGKGSEGSEAPGSHGGSTRTLISTPIPRVPRWASNSQSPPTNQRPLSITRQCGHGA
ncbi:hypothetical protein K456DRAFT_28735 [Colletotrichum gloeosporioides 23]|nr:hypothetical protein K456DRAFT_28735 [Colletotrichum gloeosporioides 23]